ncbi:MAG: 1,4-dihydroxy-2-naphthoate polyprenyltransferase [Clostridiales bacterium]|nr:1,4-dihydroxy-2-naphthoate polyprenyltransferase [Clostridiales bacterium]
MKKTYTKLTLKILNELVEFRTSVGIITSVISGTVYAFYLHKTFNSLLFLAMLTASILLDGAATVFNHFFDFKNAKTKEGYLYNVHNPIVAYKLSPVTAFIIGIFLVMAAGLLGIYIILSTHWILLPVGGLSILISYFYSGGKYPISHTPFGEIVSGFFEGTIVFSIAYFVQSSSYSLHVLLVSVPIALGIANIMLANNTCDTEEDKQNGRNTLPIVIGQDNAIKVLYISHILMYILNTIYFLLGYLPVGILITYLLLPIIIKNLRFFDKNRTKEKGFVYILKNSIIFNLMEILSLYVFSLL